MESLLYLLPGKIAEEAVTVELVTVLKDRYGSADLKYVVVTMADDTQYEYDIPVRGKLVLRKDVYA